MRLKRSTLVRARLLLFAIAALLAPGWLLAQEVRIAAASDLQFALPELAAAFERTGGAKLAISFGSSGNFRRQIAEGAPFALFFSADEQLADALITEGRAVAPGALYAVGRIVLFVPRLPWGAYALEADVQLKDLAAAAGDGRLKKLAIANPDHAPYGKAARAALQATGAWPAVQDKLVLGENVAQAARFATTGGAQAAILPLALVLAPEVGDKGKYVTLPDTLHPPLRQKMVLIQGASAQARAFYDFVQSAAGREILARYGFVLPR